jgi:hypothetical protein
MDWVWKGMLTTASVALVLAFARRWGGGAAGLLAGLPTTTGPALGFMAAEHGERFAAAAAAATVAACAMVAAFALAYAHAAAARRPPRVALAFGTAGALLLGGPALAAGGQLVPAVALALVCCGVALLAWPAEADDDKRPAGSVRSSPVMPAALAGGISVCLGVAGPVIGTLLAGLLASLPVVSVSVALAQHAVAGPAVARCFLRGTVVGLWGRVAFGAVFAMTVCAHGVAWAVGLAALAAGTVNLVWVGCLALQRRGAVGRLVMRDANRRGQPCPLADPRTVQ